jgi:hypothetical protein
MPSSKFCFGAEDRGDRSGRHRDRCFTLARARAEPLAITMRTRRLKIFSHFFLHLVAMSAEKSPASEEAGPSIRLDQSPLRRDQISVKLSSPSPFTSEA